MADDFELSFEGLSDFHVKLEEVRARYPYKEEEILLKLGASLKAGAIEKTPIGKRKKHLRSQYKLSKVNYMRDGTSITLTNTSPLFHLVEKGHNIVIGGRLRKGKTKFKSGTVVGFVPGVHMVERAMIELEQTLPATVDAWLDSVLGGLK